jgi:hypothetical protein
MIEIQTIISKFSYPQQSEPTLDDYKVEKPQITIDTNFKLPISYLEQSETFTLSDIVSTDLELATTMNGSNGSMYDYLFQPKHQFARNMIQQWKQQYTTNQTYLTDTQQVISEMSLYKNEMSKSEYNVNCDKITTIWEDIKVENDFLNRYGYIDWEMFAEFNESSVFLQSLAVMNTLSPAFSLFLPILFFIFPFLILKIQGIPITFEIYITVLKDLARHHFIGKALMTLESLSMDKVIYLLITFGLYLIQIYQNIHQCQIFYENIKTINENLLEIRDFSNYSISSMENFLLVTKNMPSYEKISVDIRTHCDNLKKLHSEIYFIKPFVNSINKYTEIGYMLRCYYRLHSNKDFEDCLRYAVGFEGYINNLLGIYENIMDGKITFSRFDSSGNCNFEEQYYPPLMNELPVKNSCDFKKNMIISSPNKSGKTTILKTTTINIIFTQQVGCGFYKSGKLNPYTHIHSYLNIPDTSGRDSLFQAESRRCKEIIDIIKKYNDITKYRHFCIFDELYSGTNPDEASKAGYAFLKYLNNIENVNYILTTHYFSICKKFNKSEKVQNYKMEVNILGDGTFDYTYKIKKGISKIKGGIRVLKDMEYPDDIIKTMEKTK